MCPRTPTEPRQEALLEMDLSLVLGLGFSLKASQSHTFLAPNGLKGNGLLDQPNLHNPFQKNPTDPVHFFLKIADNTLPSPQNMVESFPLPRLQPYSLHLQSQTGKNLTDVLISIMLRERERERERAVLMKKKNRKSKTYKFLNTLDCMRNQMKTLLWD
jgi:hypothetical protein